MVVVTFFWRRYNRRKDGSSNLLPRNTSADLFSKSDRQGSDIFFGVSIFSYIELVEATHNFASENELGDGGFGIVHYGKKIYMIYLIDFRHNLEIPKSATLTEK